MPKVKILPIPKLYLNNKIDLILIEAMGLTAYKKVVGDISFEWLLGYSQISLQELT